MWIKNNNNDTNGGERVMLKDLEREGEKNIWSKKKKERKK